MILARLSLIFALIAYGSSNSMSGTFQTCSFQCSNENPVGDHPVSDNSFRSNTLLRGKSGPRGEKGKVGHPGAKGVRGEKGDEGRQGIKGSHGEYGRPGIPGRQGQKGEDGKSSNETLIQELQTRITELESDSVVIHQLRNKITELEADVIASLQFQQKMRPQNCSQIKELNPEAPTARYMIYDNIYDVGREVDCDMSAEGVCVAYTLRATSKLSFDAARAQCVEQGGDLLQNNLGPDGVLHHSEIRQLAEGTVSGGENKMWVGYTDIESEGTWRFLNGDLYDARSSGQSAAFYWRNDKEPNNHGGNEDCAVIVRHTGSLGLDDHPCQLEYYGLCEIKTSC